MVTLKDEAASNSGRVKTRNSLSHLTIVSPDPTASSLSVFVASEVLCISCIQSPAASFCLPLPASRTWLFIDLSRGCQMRHCGTALDGASDARDRGVTVGKTQLPTR
jgi:hypothetical protein